MIIPGLPSAFRNPVDVIINDTPPLRESIESLVALPRVAVLIGTGSAERTGALARVTELLTPMPFEIIKGIPPEPAQSDVLATCSKVEQAEANVILALGGGSVIDTAKLVTLIFHSDLDLVEVMNRTVTPVRRQLPLLAIPTTAGSGSEVTPFAVVTNNDTHIKQSLPSPSNYPDMAFLMPALLRTLPPKVIGDSGIDALAHALEALWSIHRNPVSTALAEEAAARVFRSLPVFYENPDDDLARFEMAVGSMIAGLAFSNTFTAACHGLSYPLSSRFHLTHGASCGLTLAAVAGLNSRDVQTSFDAIALLAGLPESSIPDSIRALINRVDSLPTLASLNPSEDDLAFVSQNSFAPLMRNNPVSLDDRTILELLKSELADSPGSQ